MRNLIFTAVVATTLLVSASDAHAQIGGGLSPGGLLGGQGLIPRTPPPTTLPMPQTPAQQWVPEQRQYDPAIGRNIEVPGHYADRTPDGRLIQPPMTIPARAGDRQSSCAGARVQGQASRHRTFEPLPARLGNVTRHRRQWRHGLISRARRFFTPRGGVTRQEGYNGGQGFARCDAGAAVATLARGPGPCPVQCRSAANQPAPAPRPDGPERPALTGRAGAREARS